MNGPFDHLIAPGAPLPAMCRRCGLVFPSAITLPTGSGHLTVTMQGNITDCPRCGGWADTVDTAFVSVAGEVKHLITGPFTDQQVEELKQISKRLSAADQSQPITDDVIEVLEAVSPELAKVAQMAKNKKWTAASVSLLILLALSRCGSSPGGDININIGGNQTIIEQPMSPDGGRESGSRNQFDAPSPRSSDRPSTGSGEVPSSGFDDLGKVPWTTAFKADLLNSTAMFPAANDNGLSRNA